MSSEGFLIGIDLQVHLKLCRFLMIFLNGYTDTLKVDLFSFTVKKETTTYSALGPKTAKTGYLIQIAIKNAEI